MCFLKNMKKFVLVLSLFQTTSVVVTAFVDVDVAVVVVVPSPPRSCCRSRSRSRYSSSLTATTATSDDFGALPVKQGTIQVTRKRKRRGSSCDDESNDDAMKTFNLSYNLVRPMSLSSRQAAPIVVVHGGGLSKSNYLFPLAKHVPYRSILFYDEDQLVGGGGDDDDDTNYSIEHAVEDLEVILKKLSIRRFHLYGHGFGGIVAYEYLKKQCLMGNDNNDVDDDEGCLSFILSSTPTSIKQLETEKRRLMKELNNDNELFRLSHVCRRTACTTPDNNNNNNIIPQKSLLLVVDNNTDGGGSNTAIQDYDAAAALATTAGSSKSITTMPSAMILRGEYDYVTEACCRDWKETILCRDNKKCRSVRERTIEDCSHYGLYENGPLYGELIDSFFTEYD